MTQDLFLLEVPRLISNLLHLTKIMDQMGVKLNRSCSRSKQHLQYLMEVLLPQVPKFKELDQHLAASHFQPLSK